MKNILSRLFRRKINRQQPEHNTNTDRCICCGDVIPEGRTVCWKCEHEGE